MGKLETTHLKKEGHMDYNVYLACKNKKIKKQIFEKGEKIIDQITNMEQKKNNIYRLQIWSSHKLQITDWSNSFKK